MATNAVALAWRSAGRRAPALHTLRATQRPSILHRESLLRQVRYSSDAASQTKEAAKETTAQVTETVKEAPKKTGRKLKRTIWGTSLALSLLAGFIYGTDTRASVHRYGVVPLVRLLFPDAEDAHHFGVDILKTLYKYGLNPRERGDPDSDGALLTEVYSPFSIPPNLNPPYSPTTSGLRLHPLQPDRHLRRPRQARRHPRPSIRTRPRHRRSRRHHSPPPRR